jgi:hypothetical protein
VELQLLDQQYEARSAQYEQLQTQHQKLLMEMEDADQLPWSVPPAGIHRGSPPNELAIPLPPAMPRVDTSEVPDDLSVSRGQHTKTSNDPIG